MGNPGRRLCSTSEGGGKAWTCMGYGESQDGDVFWNQSQQDLLMNGTWGMRKGESCHARLQVSGPSTWVDGGAFSQDPGMTGGGADIGGGDIKILLQKT